MKSPNTNVAWLLIVVGVCITCGPNDVLAYSEDAYTFPVFACGKILQDNDPLLKARKTILINVVTVHSSPDHRSEFTTCINTLVPGRPTMYAAASCPDPTNVPCDVCLREAQAFLDHNCPTDSEGNAIENAMTCTMRFGTSPDVCKG